MRASIRHSKWLGQIIVGAEIKRGDFVVLGVTHALAAHFQSIDERQAKVEQQVRPVHHQPAQPLAAYN